ncbi:3-hydroxybutyryl-CoA dehydrogenase [Clostridium sp. 'deep sea']|uniref:3-hydroxybutyryl-CoA dehydrogenase n=1 Tax=Clostridium sp. 'deep sea' TaxID=2779445 RepID=UPI001A9BE180|nr:3-hydroxybutyryl-CoA dehydrogenase [Clostridium sp. 'deep sea']
MINKIAVIGAGTMGRGIAQILIASGINTLLCDIKIEYAEAGKAYIAKRFDKSVAKARMTEEDKNKALALLETKSNLKELSDCDLVIEAASEQMDIKKVIFKELDEICKPETILATNTSSLSITEISQATNRPDKVIGMHFFNPVPVMKLVEVIKGLATSQDVNNSIIELANKLGKTPVPVAEAPGFVVNRVLIPMINEAIGIYADGVASAQDIDTALKLGANHPIGPLALGDLIGLDVCLAIMEVLHTEFGEDKYRPHPLLKKMVRGGLLGRKTKHGFYAY